jgi:predicted heme/steroid binding protein
MHILLVKIFISSFDCEQEVYHMRKSNQLLIVLFLFVFIFAACGTSDETPSETSTESETEELTLTLEELEMYDGTNGNPAYVAVDGEIYDVSDSSFWKEGAHNGFQAGRDLTEAIKNESPHGVKNLERVPKVGRIVD